MRAFCCVRFSFFQYQAKRLAWRNVSEMTYFTHSFVSPQNVIAKKNTSRAGLETTTQSINHLFPDSAPVARGCRCRLTKLTRRMVRVPSTTRRNVNVFHAVASTIVTIHAFSYPRRAAQIFAENPNRMFDRPKSGLDRVLDQTWLIRMARV